MNGSEKDRLTPRDIEILKSRGYNQNQIAERYGITRQAVSWIKTHRARSWSKTYREQMNDHYPWNTTGGFSDNYVDHRMRDHGEWVLSGGLALSAARRKRLRYFYNSLTKQNVVVEFDPNFAPSGGSKIGGFRYRARKISDGNLMIRINKHTNVTEMGGKLWQLPERRFWP